MHMQLCTAYAISDNTCNKVHAAFCCRQALLRGCQVDATIPTSPMGPEVGGVSTVNPPNVPSPNSMQEPNTITPVVPPTSLIQNQYSMAISTTSQAFAVRNPPLLSTAHSEEGRTRQMPHSSSDELIHPNS